MDKLTNIIESVLFASGKAVAVSDIADKLNVTEREVNAALRELRKKYGEEGGIQLLEFNKKAQLASNPQYKEEVAAVLNPIREKELTRTVLECAAIIAYKQPITRSEIELLRGVNSDYAVNMLLELKLIYPCGRKDAVGRPVLFATTDEFLKRFKLESLAELPDYDTLMATIAAEETDRDSYLYARKEYGGTDGEENIPAGEEVAKEGTAPEEAPKGEEEKPKTLPADTPITEGGYELPDFLQGLDDDLVKIS